MRCRRFLDSLLPITRMPCIRTVILLILCSASRLPAQHKVDFNFDVKPILSDRCYVCHGPDAENRQAELRFDIQAGITKESESGNVDKIVEAGKPDESELWLRISSTDPDTVMPPADSNLQLSEDEKRTIQKWIEQGAHWQVHWAFLPIRPASLPSGVNSVSAIDYFVEARLKESGFTFAEVAAPEQLIRRATFDITGLPPTLEEIDAFLADGSPGAFEQVVDRLLDSPRYGERMASQWLDVARYSDTYGYQVDRDRFVWPYRDWVIRAFNRNLPYSDFVTQQLAGDLLPDATDDQVLATTFNRLHPQKVEGGSVPEEFRVEYVSDRTQTFATSMLGLTLECARCHDHKYDPISQKEYYQLTAFFDKIDEAGLYSYFTPAIPTPTLLLEEKDTKQRIADLAERIAEEEAKLRELRQRLRADWNRSPRTVEKVDDVRGQIEYLQFEDLKPEGPNKPVEGIVGQAAKLTGDDGIKLKTGNFDRCDPFTVALWLKVPTRRQRAVVFHRSRAWTDAGSRGYQLLIEEGRLSASLIHFWPGNAIRVKSVNELPINEWQHVVMAYDGSSRAAGLRLFLDGELMETEVYRDHLYKQITGGGNDHITIGERFRDLGLSNGLVDEFRVFDRELTAAEARHLFDGNYLSKLSSAANLSPAEQEDDFDYFLSRHQDFRQQLEALRKVRKQHNELVDSLPEIMVMRELSRGRNTYVLKRGAYDARGELANADTPACLPPMSQDLPKNRLGLAAWLTDSDHPLTARVAVNRVWQLMFGQGLVRTPEDFGSQGQNPTHPELLDWLAGDFIARGWDLKRLIKQIVMSRTYRQSSTASAELLARDAENRLYGRSPSYRWPAEMLRDQALAAGELIVEKIGGAPVKPYELEVSFKPTKPDEGDGLYRRSLYTYWKRTGPAPAMMALDAAKRDVCRMQRSRTSSPLQTLVLMNSPQFVEAARSLAAKAMTRHDAKEPQLDTVFRRLIGRHPDAEEMFILKRLYDGQLTRFAADPQAVQAYLSVGKREFDSGLDTAALAALTAVANTLFGLDECMMKR